MTLTDLDIERLFQELLKFQEQDSSYNLSQFKSLITAHQYRRLYETFEKYISQGSEVLDWGCGNGHFSYFLTKFGYKAFGFSFNDFPFRQVLNGYKFNQASLKEPTALPYPDCKFDAVVSVGVLEHVRETGGTEVGSLREILRILKLNGVFVCYHLPNQFSLIEFIASLLSNKYHHKYRYTRQSIETLCQQSGFELLELQQYGFLPRNMWGSLPKKLGNSPVIASIWNFLDEVLRYPFAGFCQNYLFVARKTSVPSQFCEPTSCTGVPSPAWDSTSG